MLLVPSMIDAESNGTVAVKQPVSRTVVVEPGRNVGEISLPVQSDYEKKKAVATVLPKPSVTAEDPARRSWSDGH